jgi:hypothetical protein
MITQIDSVRKRWKEKFGRSPTEEDVARMFENFVPMQLACLEEYSEMITGRNDPIHSFSVYVHYVELDWILRIFSSPKQIQNCFFLLLYGTRSTAISET